ncbi:MAG: DUF3050 domain-containing protein [Pirellulales bacterium]
MTSRSVISAKVFPDLGDLRDALLAHRIYGLVDSERALRTFMRTHVFCVWDFQCLMKALQRDLSCTTLPWTPTADPAARRLVNTIVLDEESDVTADGRALSHFEMYLEAMRDCGADTGPIDRFLSTLQIGQAWSAALDACGASPAAVAFVRATMQVAEHAPVHVVAASFTYGREDVIPDMFTQLVERLAAENAPAWTSFLYYLKRHIQHDGDTHGPLARSLVARLCGDDPTLRRAAETAARDGLRRRIALWDALADEIALGASQHRLRAAP